MLYLHRLGTGHSLDVLWDLGGFSTEGGMQMHRLAAFVPKCEVESSE